jgi:uncharacterized damage-inducible protein DinB
MLSMTDELIAEFAQEAQITRRVLERVPTDKLSWKPHAKSMSLGQLALHIASVPAGVAEFLSEPVRDAPFVPVPEARTHDEILSTLDKGVAIANAKLAAWKDQGLDANFKMTQSGRTVLDLRRFDMVRSVMLNHWYHHRGQLTVYLRLLGVAVPSVYGPSADENPFAASATAQAASRAQTTSVSTA